MKTIETFTFRGNTYKILPEYYSASHVPMALKHIAIQRGTKTRNTRRLA